jgi:undecaprenyl-diphosphatase
MIISMINYIILGTIQGIFEWLPVSSEGITALFSSFLNKSFEPIDLALFLHLGTLLAALLYFWKDWVKILKGENKKLFRFLIISTLASLIISYPLYKIIKNFAFGSGLLLLMGFGLLGTAYASKHKFKFRIQNTPLAFLSGFLQGLAVIPGLSRSGSTIFALSLGGLTPREILKISYLMSVPIIAASSLYLFLQEPNLLWQAWPALIVSFLIGLFFLHLLFSWVQKINFAKFALIFSGFCFLGAILGLLL